MRLSIIAITAALCLPVPAFAGIFGTAHDIDLGNGNGPCFTCHVPHQAAGERFWAQEPVPLGKVGTVAGLCASCHHSGEGYGAVMTRAHSDDHVYGPNSHGQRMYLADPPPGTDVLASGLPGIDTRHGYFECTTCHSVHDDTYRPFLRDDPNALCARCHRLRHYVKGFERSGAMVEAGKWGVDRNTGRNNPGSHPVGEDVVGDRNGGPVVEIPSIFRVPFSKDPGKWSLGGHLTEGSEGGVTCLTCHAVHGTQPDPDDIVAAVMETPPNPGFLVVAQSEGSVAGYSRRVPNGAGDANRLCEACHGVGNNPIRGPGTPNWTDKDHNVNPGREGAFSHPVDSYPSSVDAHVSRFPDGWPEGNESLAGAKVAPVPICESCHTPHPAAALDAERPDVLARAGPYLLRAPLADREGPGFCDQCHTSGIDNHHPVNRTFDSSGVPYLENARGGPEDLLTCTTCHTAAHNWTEPSWASLDPSWLPYDNGRSPDQATDMYNTDMSKTCMDCHYFMDGDGASVSPTMGSKQTVIEPADDEYRHYQTPDKSMGTHYIGLIHEDADNWQLNPVIDMFDTTRTWKEQSPRAEYTDGLAPGWARFGGEDRNGSRVLVCESCHELEPDRNDGFTHLLLAPYEEGQNGVDEYPGDDDGHDILCEACHGIPRGTHPMTGMLVSRTGRPLEATVEWLRPLILGDATLDRGLNAMSCDSCHQPHDANTNSYTFIIDAPHGERVGDFEQPVAPWMADPTRPSEFAAAGFRIANGSPETYATPTLSGAGGDHAGMCAQCHDK